jgi:Enoyl-CoA hydratase/isomerase
MSLIETKSDAAIGTISLNHPKKRNALPSQLVDAIIEALASFSRQQIRDVMLRAKPGAKVWSAGHDVDELPQGRRDPLGWDDPLRALVRSIEEFSAPVIAAVEGVTTVGDVAFPPRSLFAMKNKATPIVGPSNAAAVDITIDFTSMTKLHNARREAGVPFLP